MKAFLDGLASALAAFLTVLICGFPAYLTYRAIQFTVAPVWAWAPLVALSLVGLVMTVAFLRKAARGVSQTRERRRAR